MEDLLDQHLRLTFGLRYQEGTHDCALFVAQWADRVAGTNHYERLRGGYRTKFEGMKKFAGSGVCSTVRAVLIQDGWTEVTSNFQVGDIILTDLGTPAIWRGKSIVLPAMGAAGHGYIHARHARGGLRWIP